MLPLFAQIDLTHPARLLALALVPLILYFAWRTTTMMLAWQRISSTVCRVAIFLLLVLAAAQPVFRSKTGQKCVVIVADSSRSVSASFQQQCQPFVKKAVSQQGDRDLSCFVVFAGKPVNVGTADLTLPPNENLLAPLHSNPADALLYATGLVPEGYVPKIVLFTDGLETQDDLFTAAQGIRVPVDVVPLIPFPKPEMSVDRVIAPHHARPRVPFGVEVVIRSNRATRATVQLTTADNQLVQKEVDLAVGENRVRFPGMNTDRSDTVLTATVSDAPDDVAENNERRAVVMAADPPQVMIVADKTESAEGLRRALGVAGFRVSEIQPSADALKKANVRAGVDLVVIYDMPPSSVKADTAAALQDFVGGGGGLVVIGGQTTFAANVFEESSIEPLTPVKALARREERPPVLAMVLVIDKSKSMLIEGRMDLAKEAAKKSVNLLADRDKVGVLVFGDDAPWISDLARLSDRKLVLDRISALTPSGVTNMYPSLEKAYVALEQVDADRRYVIVITDGVPSPGDYDRLARDMAKARITVSTVTVSPGAEQTILRDIAQLAGGRHFHCDDPNEMGRFVEGETRRAAQPRSVAGIRPMVVRTLPGLDVASAPQLVDYTATAPKPQSEVLLVTPEGDPLLSWWRYRRGVVVAMTSSGQRWRSWDGFQSFAGLLARHVIQQSDLSNVAVHLDQRGQTVTLIADARDASGSFVNNAAAKVEISVSRRDAERTDETTTAADDPEPRNLPQSAPGRYEEVFRLDAHGRHDFEISVTKGNDTLHTTRRAVFADYPDELRLGEVNESLLRDVARVTGGTYDPNPEEIFADDGRRVDRTAQWWTCLLMAALVIFVIDVWLRRARFTARTAAD